MTGFEEEATVLRDACDVATPASPKDLVAQFSISGAREADTLRIEVGRRPPALGVMEIAVK